MPIIFSDISKKFKHSVLSSSNKAKIFRLDDNKTLIFHEALHCNAPSRTTKSGCSKFYLYLNGVNGENNIVKNPIIIQQSENLYQIKKNEITGLCN